MEPLKQGNIPQNYSPLPKEVAPLFENQVIADPLAAMNQTSIDTNKTALAGRVSKGVIENLPSATEAMKAVTSEMWECIAQIPNKLGGFCYEFKIKDEYNLQAIEKRFIELKDEVKRLETDWKRGVLKEPAEIAYLKSKRLERAELAKLVQGRFKENLKAKKKEIFPAVEPNEFGIFQPKDLLEPDVKIYTHLGYKQSSDSHDSSLRFTLPDKEALDANWEELRRIYREGPQGNIVPPLNVLSAAGIADDKSFIEAHLEHDALLSSGKELVHDHFAHIIPTIQQLLKCLFNPQLKNRVNPVKERAELTALFAKGYQTLQTAEKQIEALEDMTIPKNYPPEVEAKIAEIMPRLPIIKKHMDKMWAALGAYVDVSTNSFTFMLSLSEKGLKSHMNSILNDVVWKSYWNKRFDEEEMKDPEIRTMWDQLEALNWIHKQIAELPQS